MATGKLKNVQVPVEVVLGRTVLTVGEIADLGEGSLVCLDSLAGEPVEFIAAGRKIASGEVVVMEENFGIRITDLAQEA